MGCGRGDLAVDLVDGFRIPGQALRGGRHVDRERIADGLAHVQRFEQGQFVLRGQQALGKGHQDALARGGSLAGPAAVFKSAACGHHGGMDVGRLTAGNGAETPTVQRRTAFQRLQVKSRATLAIDQGAPIDVQRVCPLVPSCHELLPNRWHRAMPARVSV